MEALAALAQVDHDVPLAGRDVVDDGEVRAGRGLGEIGRTVEALVGGPLDRDVRREAAAGVDVRFDDLSERLGAALAGSIGG